MEKRDRHPEGIYTPENDWRPAYVVLCNVLSSFSRFQLEEVRKAAVARDEQAVLSLIPEHIDLAPLSTAAKVMAAQKASYFLLSVKFEESVTLHRESSLGTPLDI